MCCSSELGTPIVHSSLLWLADSLSPQFRICIYFSWSFMFHDDRRLRPFRLSTTYFLPLSCIYLHSFRVFTFSNFCYRRKIRTRWPEVMAKFSSKILRFHLHFSKNWQLLLFCYHWIFNFCYRRYNCCTLQIKIFRFDTYHVKNYHLHFSKNWQLLLFCYHGIFNFCYRRYNCCT